MSILVLHHHDFDGMVSAYCIDQYFKHFMRAGFNVEYRAVNYGDPAPSAEDVKMRLVIVVDFSFSREATEQLAQQAEQLLVVDHHKTSVWMREHRDFYDLQIPWVFTESLKSGLLYQEAPENVTAGPLASILKTRRVTYIHGDQSGALLCNALVSSSPSLLTMYANDYDMWYKRYPHTDAVELFMMRAGSDYRSAAGHYDNFYRDVAHAGDATYVDKDKTIQSFRLDEIHVEPGVIQYCNGHLDTLRTIVKAQEVACYFDPATGMVMRPAPGQVIPRGTWPALSLPPVLASKTADLMREKYPDAPAIAFYWPAPNGMVFSFRRGAVPNAPDVAEVAARFGGGGHASAAGCTIPSRQGARVV